MEWYDAHGWALCLPLFYPGCVCVHRNRVIQNASLLRNLPWMDGRIYFLCFFFLSRKDKRNCSVDSSNKPYDYCTTTATCTRQALGLFLSKEQHTIRKTTSYTIHPLNSLAWKKNALEIQESTHWSQVFWCEVELNTIDRHQHTLQSSFGILLTETEKV